MIRPRARPILYRGGGPCFLERVIPAAALLGWVTLAAAAVDVYSGTDCPSRDAIVERLLPLLPERGAATDTPDRARIEPIVPTDAAAGLRLRLETANGDQIGERQLPAAANCSEAAEAIAAIVAAWESTPVPPATQEPPAPAVAPAPVAAPPPRPDRRFELVVGGGAGAAPLGGGAALGTVELTGGLVERAWQLRLAAEATTVRQRQLADGHVDWRAARVGVGLVVRTLHPRWRLSLDAGPLLGFPTLTGVRLANSRSSRSFQYGGGAGLRLTRWFGRFAVWAEARTTAWINVVEARATSATRTESTTLPQLDVHAGLGLAARLF